MISVMGDMSYVTWGTIFVNTSGRGDHVDGGGPQAEVRVRFLDLPVSVGWGACMTRTKKNNIKFYKIMTGIR